MATKKKDDTKKPPVAPAAAAPPSSPVVPPPVPPETPPGVEPDELTPDPEIHAGGPSLSAPPAVSAAAAREISQAATGPVTAADVAKSLNDLILGLPAALAAAGLGLSGTQLKEIIQGAVEGTTQKRILENQIHPHISAFSYPEGDILRPKPKLARKTFFCGIEEKEDRLTPGEIDAYNAITTPREGRGGAWRAVLTRPRHQGDAGELQVFVPAQTVDQRMMLPGSLTLILLELNGGPDTTNVVVLLRQIETLKGMLLNKGLTATELEAQMLAAGAPAA